MTSDRQRLLERAQLACGRLDAITALLPDPDVFLYSYVRREAVLSSQIEGTQSSLSDLLLFEIKGVQAARIRGASPICARRRAHRWKACWVRRGGAAFFRQGCGLRTGSDQAKALFSEGHGSFFGERFGLERSFFARKMPIQGKQLCSSVEPSPPRLRGVRLLDDQFRVGNGPSKARWGVEMEGSLISWVCLGPTPDRFRIGIGRIGPRASPACSVFLDTVWGPIIPVPDHLGEKFKVCTTAR
jgi:hypothetical protein